MPENLIEDQDELNQIQDVSQQSVDIDQLRNELSEAISKAEENLNGWKRTQADFENYQRRKENESNEWINFGKSSALMQLLPVLDSLEQALVHAPETGDDKYMNWRSGLQGIVKQLSSTLSAMGIEKIESVGKKFDPNLQEAVREVPGEEDGIVAEQLQTGYILNGKLIRQAQVVITKKQV